MSLDSGQPQEPGETPPVVHDPLTAVEPHGPEAQPWTGWDVLLVAITFVFSDLLASAAAGLCAMRVYHESLDALASDVRVIVPAQLVAYAITFLLIYLLVSRSYHRPFWSAIRWSWPSALGAIFGFVVVGALVALGISSLETMLPMPSHVPFERLFTTAEAAYIIGALAIFAAPFMEELFFRGFLFPVLERFGLVAAIVLTSLAFAVVHGVQYGWAPSAVLLMFLVGLVLTTTRAWTGSVACGFLIHFGYNLTLFAVLYFSTGHFRHVERISQ